MTDNKYRCKCDKRLTKKPDEWARNMNDASSVNTNVNV